MKKLLLTLLVGIGLFSCGGDYFYIITDASLNTAVKSDTSDHFYSVSPDSIYQYELLRFQLEPITSIVKTTHFNLGNQAYAYSYQPNYTLMDQLIDVNVYTEHNYNDKYPAGANINDLITFTYGGSMEDFIYEINHLKDYYYTISSIFQLAEAPSDTNMQVLKVVLTLENQSYISSYSIPFKAQ